MNLYRVEKAEAETGLNQIKTPHTITKLNNFFCCFYALYGRGYTDDPMTEILLFFFVG